MSHAICILVDKNGKTIGARLEINGRIGNIVTEALATMTDRIQLDNAIVDKNGFIRGKNGVSIKKVTLNTSPNTIENREHAQVAKLIKSGKLMLYRGTKDKTLVPKFGMGKIDNDYGRGFYTTPNKELGKEWAWGTYDKGLNGYLYTYELDLNGLEICDLTKLDSLHWMAELFYNRTFNLNQRTTAHEEDRKKFISKYKLDTSSYDIIIGYRADDSYFTYAEDFLTGGIYRENIENALRFGDLGIQVFIKSKLGFSRMRHISIEEVPKIYEMRYTKRDEQARIKYLEAKRNRDSSKLKQRIFDFI